MKKVRGFLTVVAVAALFVPSVVMAADVKVDKALYGANCAAPGSVCVDVTAKLQGICDAQNTGCKTKEIGTVEKFGEANEGGLHAELTCIKTDKKGNKTETKESSDNASGTCMTACGARTPCLK